MNLKDLPEWINVVLPEDEGISYPYEGECATTFEVNMYCFSAKQYLQTWPLRQRVMQAFATLTNQFKDLATEEAEEEGSKIDANQFKQMMLMSSFDLMAALEEFKQIAVVGKLIFLDDAIHLNKERWNMLPDTTKETLCFEYLAAFIQPCVI